MIDVSPLRTTIMEIGSPGNEEGSDVWVRARQYTGRVVTVSNKAFFDEPIYNYSKDFDYIWDPVGPLEVNLAVRVQRRAGVSAKISAQILRVAPTGSPAPPEEPAEGRRSVPCSRS